MIAATVTELVRNGNIVGERVELGRYRVPGAGERLICGQRIDGVVRLVDVPASGAGRRYLIERELERDGYSALKALVADYLAQARARRQIPVAENVLGRYLDHVSDETEVTK